MLEKILINFSEVHRAVTYAIIFLGMFVEGEIILILTGVLVRGGAISFFPALAVSFAGTVLCDVFYWSLGKRLVEKGKNKFLFFTTENTAPILKNLEKRSGFLIFLSKFAWNFNRVVLVCSGYARIRFKEFLKYSVSSSAVWAVLLISLGYVFANETDILKQDVKRIAIFITVFIIIILFFESMLKKLFNFKDENGNSNDGKGA